MDVNQMSWERLEVLLSQHAPTLFGALKPPAATSEIEAVEVEIGVRFPDELRAAYLRHNGIAKGVVHEGPSFFVGVSADWLNLADVLDRWRMKRRSYEEWTLESPAFAAVSEVNELKIRYEFWNSKRIPIGQISGGPLLVVDLWPGDSGVCGQLITDDGLGDFSDECVVYTSLNEYLTLFADRLEQGLIAYVPGKSWVNQRGETIADWCDLSGW
jgi:cell wall assembly regulator SMI1